MSISETISTLFPRERAFYEAAKRGELLIQSCIDCKADVSPTAYVCPRCRSLSLEWQVSSGEGTVYSYTTVPRPRLKELADQGEAVVVMVDLDEGVRIMGRLVGDRRNPKIGDKVTVTFEPLADDVAEPCFALSATTATSQNSSEKS